MKRLRINRIQNCFLSLSLPPLPLAIELGLWWLCSICHLQGYYFRKNSSALTNRESGTHPKPTQFMTWLYSYYSSSIPYLLSLSHIICAIALPTGVTYLLCYLGILSFGFVADLNSRTVVNAKNRQSKERDTEKERRKGRALLFATISFTRNKKKTR